MCAVRSSFKSQKRRRAGSDNDSRNAVRQMPRTPNKQQRPRASPRRSAPIGSPSSSIKKSRRPAALRQDAADQAAKDRSCLGLFSGITDWLEKYHIDATEKLKGCMSIRPKNQRSATESAGPAHAASKSSAASNVVGRVGWLLQRYSGQQLIPGVLQLSLAGGEEFVIDGVAREVRQGQAARTDTTITMSAKTFAELMHSSSGSRTKTAVSLYFTGRLKVQGDLNLAMRFAELADIALRSYTESEA